MSQKLFLRTAEVGNVVALNNILNQLYQRVEALEQSLPTEVNVSFFTTDPVENSFPVPCACPVATPTRVKVGRCMNLTAPRDTFYESVYPDWSYSSGVIQLNYVSGLTTNSQYLLTLEVSSG